jgi:LacI family transcriptional regulator
MIFLGDLRGSAVREACIGAAEYAAGQPHLDFEPWSILPDAEQKSLLPNICDADCVILNEWLPDWTLSALRISPPCAYVLGTQRHPGACSAGLDERAVGEMAADHLLDRGYRNLACLTYRGSGWATARAQSFARAGAARGVKCRTFSLPGTVFPPIWSSVLSARLQGVDAILKRLPRPCGVFAVNDSMACAVIHGARHQGFSVPHDIGVIGVDDDPISNAAAGITISSVQLPFREAGRLAAAALDALRQQKGPPVRLKLQPVRVVVRASTDVFMVKGGLLSLAQAFIETNRHRPVRVSEVIKATGTSGVTLRKEFQRHLHALPSDYILLRRLEYATELLREGRLNVQQVSDHCGFHSCSYFCKVFKRMKGSSAGQVRNLRIT